MQETPSNHPLNHLPTRQTFLVSSKFGFASLVLTLINAWHRPSRTTVIAVSAVAGAIALLLLTLCAFLIFRQRRQRRMSSINRSCLSPVTPALPMQNPAFVFPTPTFLAPVRRSDFDQKRVSKLSVAPSYYDGPESPGSGKSFEGRGMASVASSQWSILTAPPVVPQTTQVSETSNGLSNSVITNI